MERHAELPKYCNTPNFKVWSSQPNLQWKLVTHKLEKLTNCSPYANPKNVHFSMLLHCWRNEWIRFQVWLCEIYINANYYILLQVWSWKGQNPVAQYWNVPVLWLFPAVYIFHSSRNFWLKSQAVYKITELWNHLYIYSPNMPSWHGA